MVPRAGGVRFGAVRGWLVAWSLACGDDPSRERRHYPYEDEGCRVANIKSQIKRNRQNEKRRMRNKSVKSSLKTAIRKFNEAVTGNDADGATTLLRDATRKLDKAVSKGVIHKNQAANRKSAIARKLESLSS
jgi:small subunit ribosomal protein S20